MSDIRNIYHKPVEVFTKTIVDVGILAESPEQAEAFYKKHLVENKESKIHNNVVEIARKEHTPYFTSVDYAVNTPMNLDNTTQPDILYNAPIEERRYYIALCDPKRRCIRPYGIDGYRKSISWARIKREELSTVMNEVFKIANNSGGYIRPTMLIDPNTYCDFYPVEAITKDALCRTWDPCKHTFMGFVIEYPDE